MTDQAEGDIPIEVLERMACSVDFWLRAGSYEKHVFAGALRSYECGRGSRDDAKRRAHLCDLYLACVPCDCDRLVSCAQRRALRVCTAGEPYRLN